MPKLLEEKICKSENGQGKNVEKPPPFRFSKWLFILVSLSNCLLPKGLQRG
jgi:hypothetical protein